MTTATLSTAYRSFDLPWNTGSAQERRFNRILLVVLIAVTLFALIVPWLPVEKPEPIEFIEVPVEMLPLEPLPPPEEKPKPEPKPVPTKPVPQPRKPVPPTTKPVPPQPTARERAAEAMGSLADDLASLRDDNLSDITNADATINSAPSEAATTTRAMITSNAGKASGGISTESLNRGTGGSGLAGRSGTKVTGPALGSSGKGAAGGKSGTGDGVGSRSREEIELVFDRNKGALYALYTRALRANPALQGKVVLRLTIQPNGTVSSVEIVSSELRDPDLEAKLVSRVKLFKFQDKDVAPVTTTKPLDFFPS